MAFGLWKKIKQGIKKVAGGIGKAIGWVNDKIIKPVIKPLAPVLGGIANAIIPGSGIAVAGGINAGSSILDKIAPKLKGGKG
jgi:hypothetical protein